MSMAFFQFLVSTAFSFFHPFFISMTDINHNAADKELEVSVRIFTDDFEKTLRRQCNCKVELIKPADRNAMNALVSNYVSKHLQIVVDGKPVTLQFAGYQQEDASMWNYFEVKGINSVKKIDVTSDIMFDFTEQQINMFHVKVNTNERSDKLEYPDKKISFSF